MRFTYTKGQSVSPAYEGFMSNADGSYTLYFGYMNSNWQEEFDIPVGAENKFEPGPADQGQPTHFYPRRNPFLFTVHVPKDFGTKELIWTLTSNGRTEKAYASLKSDYLIDPQVISTEVGGDFGSLRDELRYNIPPELEIKGETRITIKTRRTLYVDCAGRRPRQHPRAARRQTAAATSRPACEGRGPEAAIESRSCGPSQYTVGSLSPSVRGRGVQRARAALFLDCLSR